MIKELSMRKLNIIVVFNKKMDRVLFCIRAKEPYKGMYNFVGGKVEEGESNDDAAYRELFEETGISHDDIELDHFMDLNYFKYENNLQVYYGILKHKVDLVEEKNKLEWLDIDDNLLDNSKFAGNYNIPHIIRQIKVYLQNDY
jgi:8-oxo-dGTP diphosphatase